MILLFFSAIIPFTRCDGISLIKFLTQGLSVTEISSLFTPKQIQLLSQFSEKASIHDLLNVDKNITEQFNRLSIFLSSFRTIYYESMISNIPAIYATFKDFFVFMGLNTTMVYSSMMKVEPGMSIFDGFAKNGCNFTGFLNVFDALKSVISDQSYTFEDLHKSLNITVKTNFEELQSYINENFKPESTFNMEFVKNLVEIAMNYTSDLLEAAKNKIAPIQPVMIQIMDLKGTPLEVRYSSFKTFYQGFSSNPLAVIFPPPLISVLASLNSQLDNLIGGKIRLDSFIFDLIGIPPEKTRLLMNLVSFLIEPKSIFEFLVKTAQTLNVDQEIASYSPYFIIMEETVRFLNNNDYELYSLFYLTGNLLNPVIKMINEKISYFNIPISDLTEFNLTKEGFKATMDDISKEKKYDDCSSNTKTFITFLNMFGSLSLDILKKSVNLDTTKIKESLESVKTAINDTLNLQMPEIIKNILGVTQDMTIEQFMNVRNLKGVLSLIKAGNEIVEAIIKGDETKYFSELLSECKGYVDFSSLFLTIRSFKTNEKSLVLATALSTIIKDSLAETKIKDILTGIVEAVNSEKALTKENIINEQVSEFEMLNQLVFGYQKLICNYLNQTYNISITDSYYPIARKLRTGLYLSLNDIESLLGNQTSEVDTRIISQPLSDKFLYANEIIDDHFDIKARVLDYDGYPLIFANNIINSNITTAGQLIVTGYLNVTGNSIISAYNMTDSINFNSAVLNIKCDKASIPMINLVSSSSIPNAINIEVDVEGLDTTTIKQIYTIAKPIIVGDFDCNSWHKKVNMIINGQSLPLVVKCTKESSGVTIPGNNKQMLVIRTSTAEDLEDEDSSKLSGGSIAGIAIAAVVVVIAIVAFIVLAAIKRKKN